MGSTSVQTTYGKSTKAAVLNRPLQLLIPLELSISENVETVEKGNNKPLQSIIEKQCDITLDENIENRRSKQLTCKKCKYYEKLMFEQWDIEI